MIGQHSASTSEYFIALSPSFVLTEGYTSPNLIGSGEETMLVDVDKMILHLAREALSTLGYTPLAANDPGEAIRFNQVCRTDRFKLTDVPLPRMEGSRVSKRCWEVRTEVEELYISGS